MSDLGTLQTPTVKRFDFARLVARWSSHGALLLAVVLVLVGSLFVSSFFTQQNFVQILQTQSFVGIAAVGMTYVVLSGNFVDLSVPVTMAVAANGFLGLFDRSIALAVVVALGFPLLIGLANGLLVGVARANPVITTLGSATVAGGLLLLVTNGVYESPTGTALQHTLGTAKIAGIPVSVIVFLALLIIGDALLTLTRFGAEMRFTGANRDAARASGVRVDVIVTCSFVICAVCAAVAGVLLGAFSNQADLTTGTGYDFDALAAVVIGGTSLLGGIGSFRRTLVGVLVIGVSNNLMLLLGLNTPFQLFVQGAIVILAVSLDAIASRNLRG
jgi:ribose transport system permease protein